MPLPAPALPQRKNCYREAMAATVTPPTTPTCPAGTSISSSALATLIAQHEWAVRGAILRKCNADNNTIDEWEFHEEECAALYPNDQVGLADCLETWAMAANASLQQTQETFDALIAAAAAAFTTNALACCLPP